MDAKYDDRYSPEVFFVQQLLTSMHTNGRCCCLLLLLLAVPSAGPACPSAHRLQFAAVGTCCHTVRLAFPFWPST